MLLLSLIVSFVCANDYFQRKRTLSKLPKTPPMQFNKKPIKFKQSKTVKKALKPVKRRITPKLKTKSRLHKLPPKIPKIQNKQLQLIPRPRPLGRCQL